MRIKLTEEEKKERKRESERKWRTENPEKKRESERKWRTENREKVCESRRKWYAENREKASESRRKSYANSKIPDGLWVVYVLRSSLAQSRYKIGITNNPAKRITTLKGATGDPDLSFVKIFSPRSKEECKRFEKALLAMHGPAVYEWVTVSGDFASELELIEPAAEAAEAAE